MIKPVPMNVGSMDVHGGCRDTMCGMCEQGYMEGQNVDAVAKSGIQCYNRQARNTALN